MLIGIGTMTVSKYNILIKIGEDIVKIIGERLKELWTGVQLSQTQIGKMFGTEQSDIFKYESACLPFPQNYAAICGLLRCIDGLSI